uniref:BZIP domain-containing protein n=1 Tax=Heterorhabditis bacteriophora TaxID=37862 RepID=A0A1I7XP34_HETBA
MLSRITRMTTMSAQILGGCSLLRDGPTAPKVATKVTASEYVSHDHSQYCKATVRQRSSSSSCGDPFLGLGKEDFYSFDEMLDLDSRKHDVQLSLGKLNHFFLTGVVNLTIKRLAAPPINSLWNGELRAENDDCIAWMEQFSTIDTTVSSSSESGCFSSLSSNVFELASHLVDWQAWDRYLDDDCSTVKKFETNDAYVFASLVPKEKPPNTDSGLVPNIISPKYGCQDKVCVPSSGPLVRLPNCIQESDCETKSFGRIFSFRQTSHSRHSPFSSYSSDEWDEGRIVIKKRGVKMKPLLDEHTNRRRAMNRVAALRYRERKRKEQTERKRLDNSLCL